MKVRYFHVVGGGCYGTQYVKWLLRARRLQMVDFEKIVSVDRDPRCRLSGDLPAEASVVLANRDWVDYLTGYLRDHLENVDAAEDQWVPSPLSPHLIFESFIAAARFFHPGLEFHKIKFHENTPPLVQIPLASGDRAVSFAEWICPVNCIEPARCPAIHALRTWDMKSALENYFKQASSPLRSTHVLQCRHLVHGVGTIPMGDILGEFNKLLEALSQGRKEVVVATTSGCHGLISAGRIQDSSL